MLKRSEGKGVVFVYCLPLYKNCIEDLRTIKTALFWASSDWEGL